jgi:hypothetical protein
VQKNVPFSAADLSMGLFVACLILVLTRIVETRSARPSRYTLAVVIKLLTCAVYNLIFVSAGPGSSDTIDQYYPEGLKRAAAVRDHLSLGSLGALLREAFVPQGNSTGQVYALSGLTHLVFLDSLLASSFVFAAVGLVGQFLLYRTFRNAYPHPRLRRWWRLGIIYFPSLIFWSAGLLKDPLGIFGLGCVLWGAQELLPRTCLRSALAPAGGPGRPGAQPLRGPVAPPGEPDSKAAARALSVAVLGVYVLCLVRLHILAVLFIALLPQAFLAWRASRGRQTSAGGQRAALPLAVRLLPIVGCLVGAWAVHVLKPAYSVDRLPKTLVQEASLYQETKSKGGPDTEASWVGVLRSAPTAFCSVLYRPFPWEASGLLQLFAAAENFLLACLALRAVYVLVRYPRVLARAVTAPLFLTCVLFVVLYGLAVGISTPNLGTLSRYRIPLLPFYVGMCLILERLRGLSPVAPSSSWRLLDWLKGRLPRILRKTPVPGEMARPGLPSVPSQPPALRNPPTHSASRGPLGGDPGGRTGSAPSSSAAGRSQDPQ